MHSMPWLLPVVSTISLSWQIRGNKPHHAVRHTPDRSHPTSCYNSGLAAGRVDVALTHIHSCTHSCASKHTTHTHTYAHSYLQTPHTHTLSTPTSKGGFKLADFGLARIYGSPDRRLTPQVFARWYRPPELLFGATAYSGTVDIWAAGCVFAGELVVIEGRGVGSGGRSDV